METQGPPRKSTSRATIVLVVIIVLLGATFAYVYYQQEQLLALNVNTTEASQLTVNEKSGALVSVVNFTAGYAGEVKITGTSTTNNAFILVNETNGFSQTLNFGTGSVLYVNIVPGTVSLYLGNHDLLNGASATLTVVYIS